ncbi:MAG: phage virion morphogenesis protein, partial [Pseudomonadota bacterium]
MSGLSLNLTLEGMDLAMDFATRLSALDMGELREGVGGLIESQTKRRIMSEKTSPDGEAWADNGRDNPIMNDTGSLNDSIAYAVAGENITVGSGLIYAAQRQFGGVIKAVNAQRLVFTVGGKT